MAEWRQFANRQKQKRAAKGKSCKAGRKDDVRSEIIVQRMSADVSGKQQKYNRIGAREYVPFEDEELTFENIVLACEKHFEKKVDKDMVCDILAGERGPSCNRLSQIPDLKVFYVRFIKRETTVVDDEDDIDMGDLNASNKRKVKKPHVEKAASSPSPVKDNKCQSFYPKSLSIKDMLKLGTQLEKKSVTVKIYKFDLNYLEWSLIPCEAEFVVSEKPFASGGFREAYKATSITKGFKDETWVVKKYTDHTKEILQEMKQTEEAHAQKSVQMHYLARNLACQLKEKVEKENLVEFGEAFKFNKVFMGKMASGKVVTVEEFISGEFVKYINNTGDRCEEDNIIADKAEAFAHFTYEKSERKFIVLDIQGSGHTLYDPEIASQELVDDDGNYQFCTGNLSTVAIERFSETTSAAIIVLC